MPINIAGKNKTQTQTQTQTKDQPSAEQAGPLGDDQQAAQAASEMQQEQAVYAGASAPPTYHAPSAPHLMTGSAQAQAATQQHALSELRTRLMQGAREFFLRSGEFASVYFLDGTLIGDEVFDTPMVTTHLAQIGGQWRKFVCNQGIEGRCVACDAGERPQTLQLFTIINTQPYEIRNGPRKGQVLPARLQLLAASMAVREKLIKRAKKNDGRLAGGLYTFTRSGDREPRVGGDVEFEKNVDYQAVIAKYPMLGTRRTQDGKFEDAPTAPLDYKGAYPILTNEELGQLRPDWGTHNAYAVPGSSGGGTIGAGPDEGDGIPF